MLGRVKAVSKTNLFKKLRSIFTIGLFLVLAGSMLFASSSAEKAKGDTPLTPRFNFLDGDKDMLRVADVTRGDTTFTDPINANIGDRVSFLLYYHNGILNSTAHNTSVRVDLPITESNKLVAKSYLWSDETEAITDTIVNGQIVGQSGATVNLPSNARIEYVAGSTDWFPNGTSTPTPMPDGIMSNSGLNIGSINGCWQYAGFVRFYADIKGPAQLVLDKSVAHPGDTNWVKEITANPGDSVAYHLGIRNNGGTEANNVLIKDTLPTYMTYTPGTTYIYTKDHPEGIKQADTLFTGGISLADVAPGQDNVVYVTYRTKIDMNIPAGSFVLVNKAQVFMCGIEQDQDQAKVYVSAQRGLTVNKTVSNGISWVKQNSAKINDVISYRIIITNTGNTPLSNVSVRDAVPVFTTYIMGSTRLDGAVASDAIVSSQGLFIGTLNPGAQKTITLQVKADGCAPRGEDTLTNSAIGKADGVTEVSDFANTILTVTGPVDPNN